MHFYTYDEWVANNYYSKDNKEIIKNQSQTYSVTDTYLTIRSCWRNPKFISTYSTTSQVGPTLDKIDCDLGCLYELETKDNNNQYIQGCIQFLKPYASNSLGDLDTPPFIKFYDNEEYFDSFSGLNKEILAINLDNVFYDSTPIIRRMLIFQSIYSGSISFETTNSSLEFSFSSVEPYSVNYDYTSYNSKIYTNMHSNDSLMIVGCELTFLNVDSELYVTIQNICDFVYGHVDMADRFNYRTLLWETYQPSNNILESSIMHYHKR